MAKNYAIAIGINHYDYIRSLKYAANDAKNVRDFLLKEAKFDVVFHYSDDSPDIDGASTLPTRSNLERLLEVTFKEPFMGDGDNFWFFFSGHGTRENGIDYLIPRDAYPENIQKSGIAVNYIIQRLKRCGADNIVLILDACREQGNDNSKSIQGMGKQTEENARQNGVISIRSCSEHEYSGELEELQQGAFTYALLEGLGSKGQKATVERLNEYLKLTVPQLTQHKGRQTPSVMVDPLEKSHLILMPKYATKTDISTLKNDAYKAQINKDFEQSKRLWIRVLETGVDMDAVLALEQIAIEKARTPEISIPPPNPPTSDFSEPEKVDPIKAEPEIELKSEVGVDYSRLKELLSQRRWKEADKQTNRVMLMAADQEEQGYLTLEDIEKFPSMDLQTIDQLWAEYSEGRFGFSVQKKIYLDCGKKPDGEYPGDTIWYKFCEKVGWRVNGECVYPHKLTFTTSAPCGYFPYTGDNLFLFFGEAQGRIFLLSREYL
ncbi:MAG: GUN4 domain-containing protein [Microcoleaceae cyanobacterium]